LWVVVRHTQTWKSSMWNLLSSLSLCSQLQSSLVISVSGIILVRHCTMWSNLKTM
jgi:hypothetical protein